MPRIRGRWASRILRAVRPLAISVLSSFPRVEEFAKRFGRDYLPLPVLAVFERDKIDCCVPVAKVVAVKRHDGEQFLFRPIDKESVIRSLLGVAHYEFGSTCLRELVLLGACGKCDLAEYFGRVRNIIAETLANATCHELLIPRGVRRSEIGRVFWESVLADSSYCVGT